MTIGAFAAHQQPPVQTAEDIVDEAILRQTLYGSVRPDEISLEQSDRMVAAAQRRVDRLKDRMAKIQELVDIGALARNELIPLKDEMAYRVKTLELAESRAKFLKELAEMAKAEVQFEAAVESNEPRPIQERFDGIGKFTAGQLKQVVLAYEKQFAKPLPISANGETSIHKALGFDHRGRVDIALMPDQPEGVWLKQYLEKEQIPFYLFRGAVAGRATAAHIHIGPPSLRLKVAD